MWGHTVPAHPDPTVAMAGGFGSAVGTGGDNERVWG